MKAVIVSLWHEKVELYFDEMEELVRTLGGTVTGRMVQRREKIDSALYFGSGKVDEIKIEAEAHEADTIIIDAEISPVQRKNISDRTKKKVLDRTDIIISIFSENAKTKEAKLQVELARLKYKLPEIKGLGHVMSRLGGGVGTKGPGEKETEYQKRTIKERIKKIELEIDDTRRTKVLHMENRKKRETKLVSIIGYTNAGKSTLMNALTGAGVLEENKLFSTLDTKVKKLYIEGEENVIISDTVGFIRKLPHILVASFKSTLEEVVFADLILEVVDISKEDFEEDIKVTQGVLDEIGAKGKEILYVFNKIDKMENAENLEGILKERYKNVVLISAGKKINIEGLIRKIAELIKVQK